MNHPTASRNVVAIVAAAAMFPLAAMQVQAHAATVHTQGSVQYVCGGVGQGAMKRLQTRADKFNLGFWMVKGPQGAYLANVPVKVMQDGKTVAQFTAGGPLCYLKAPTGTYTIEGRHDGQIRTITAQSGTTAHYLRW